MASGEVDLILTREGNDFRACTGEYMVWETVDGEDDCSESPP